MMTMVMLMIMTMMMMVMLMIMRMTILIISTWAVIGFFRAFMMIMCVNKLHCTVLMMFPKLAKTIFIFESKIISILLLRSFPANAACFMGYEVAMYGLNAVAPSL